MTKTKSQLTTTLLCLLIIAEKLCTRIKNKPKPSFHKTLNSSRGKEMNNRFKRDKYISRGVTHVSHHNYYILCEDGTKINQCECKKCNKSL